MLFFYQQTEEEEGNGQAIPVSLCIKNMHVHFKH